MHSAQAKVSYPSLHNVNNSMHWEWPYIINDPDLLIKIYKKFTTLPKFNMQGSR